MYNCSEFTSVSVPSPTKLHRELRHSCLNWGVRGSSALPEDGDSNKAATTVAIPVFSIGKCYGGQGLSAMDRFRTGGMQGPLSAANACNGWRAQARGGGL